jgi:hypothetical protein
MMQNFIGGEGNPDVELDENGNPVPFAKKEYFN